MRVVVDHGAVAHVQDARGRHDSEGNHLTRHQRLERVLNGLQRVRIHGMQRRVNECVLCRSFVHTTDSGAQTRIHHRRFVHIHNMNRDVRTALLTKDIRGENGEGVQVPLLIIHSVLKRDQSRSIADGEGAERSIVHDLETQRGGEDTRDAQRRKKNGANGTAFQNGVRRILNRQRRLLRVE